MKQLSLTDVCNIFNGFVICTPKYTQPMFFHYALKWFLVFIYLKVST